MCTHVASNTWSSTVSYKWYYNDIIVCVTSHTLGSYRVKITNQNLIFEDSLLPVVGWGKPAADMDQWTGHLQPVLYIYLLHPQSQFLDKR